MIVNELEKEIPDVTTLIHVNQCKTVKQNLDKNGHVYKKIPDNSDLVNTAALNTKVSEVENKIADN